MKDANQTNVSRKLLTTLSIFVMITLVPCMMPLKGHACVPVPDATGLTEMSGRRAVIWIKDDTFEMIFQNQYSGDAEQFAWIIPLPGVPTLVVQASDGFLDELDEYTKPILEEQRCYIPCPIDYEEVDAGLGTPDVESTVTEWGSGSLGDLEYTVITSDSNDDLLAWLSARDFELDSALEPLIQSYIDNGAAFFAAKMVSTAAEVKVVPAVRFTFDLETTEVVYPLRISAFDRTEPLPTTIWVISKVNHYYKENDKGITVSSIETYLPANYPMGTVEEIDYTEETLKEAQNEVMADNNGRTFLIQYAGKYGDSWERDMLFEDSNYHSSTDEFTQISDREQDWHMVRLHAKLDKDGADEDLVLEEAQKPRDVDGWYQILCPGGVQRESGCNSDSGCSTAAGTGAIAPVSLLSILLGLVL